MSEKMLPCPFCGGEAKVLSDSGIHGEVFRVFHQCYNSLVKLNRYGFVYRMTIDTGWYDAEEEAIAAWNTRAERTCTNSYKGGCTVAFK